MFTTCHILCSQNVALEVSEMGMNEFQMLCRGFNAVEIIKLCYVVVCTLDKRGFNFINMC
jgi:hypothetical protein